MAKTRLLPLKAGFQLEPNTLRNRYQIVTKYAYLLLPLYIQGDRIWVLENERVSNRTVKK
jgi:hypothetical protein